MRLLLIVPDTSVLLTKTVIREGSPIQSNSRSAGHEGTTVYGLPSPLPFSQELATGSCPEIDESNLRSPHASVT